MLLIRSNEVSVCNMREIIIVVDSVVCLLLGVGVLLGFVIRDIIGVF